MDKSLNLKITYALNGDGKLVHVDSVPKGNNCGCTCPACHKPLQAKNGGNIKVHHFAHQSGVECPHALESVLHLLAKERIQKAFYEQDEFNMIFFHISYCENTKECIYYRPGDCKKRQQGKVNLKEYYDSCEPEIEYDTIRRRSDLKIWSKSHPNREPVYIEIFVTHKSDAEKLHSGNRIIEVKIKNEHDIDNIIKKGFVESEPLSEYDIACGKIADTTFYGFKREVYNNKGLNEVIVFHRFILFKSGKSRLRLEYGKCKELIRTCPTALWEACFHQGTTTCNHELACMYGYDKFHIKNCMLCVNFKYHFESYAHEYRKCSFNTILGISDKEPHDTTRAEICSYFTLDKSLEERMRSSKDSKPLVYITEL